jgi:hypothetical protein
MCARALRNGILICLRFALNLAAFSVTCVCACLTHTCCVCAFYLYNACMTVAIRKLFGIHMPYGYVYTCCVPHA